MNSTAENGRSVLGVVTGDGRGDGFAKLKAGPAEVLVSAGNVPATGQPPTLPEVSIGERNYMRGILGRGVCFSLVVTGEVEPKHLAALIKLLEAQVTVLSDEVKT